MENLKKYLIEQYEKIYNNASGVKIYFAPGRVNLIGEHIDYNGGHVFPCALTIGTYGAVKRRRDKKIRYYSINYAETGIIEDSIENSEKFQNEEAWVNYLKGILLSFKERGMKIEEGFDLLIFGNIPNGAGLSSSASVEILMGEILKSMYNVDMSKQELALIGQIAENTYNGVNCGIMDQFAVAMGKKDHAIFLDTSNLSYQYVPIKLKDEKIIISCGNKKRGLADSKYNERRKECESALAFLQKVIPIKHLGELSNSEFEQYQWEIPDLLLRKRAHHAVSENVRTLEAVKILKTGDIRHFGILMNESHKSLRDDYEVTGLELDTLVEEAWKIEGVIGSRMTGAGFGGCTVSIVKKDAVNVFIEQVGEKYRKKIGYDADFYVVEIGDGPREL